MRNSYNHAILHPAQKPQHLKKEYRRFRLQLKYLGFNKTQISKFNGVIHLLSLSLLLSLYLDLAVYECRLKYPTRISIPGSMSNSINTNTPGQNCLVRVSQERTAWSKIDILTAEDIRKQKEEIKQEIQQCYKKLLGSEAATYTKVDISVLSKGPQQSFGACNLLCNPVPNMEFEAVLFLMILRHQE